MYTKASLRSARLSSEQAADLLTERGITPTRQRVEIARILLARRQHLSAEQLIELVRSGDASVSKATVYNTLGLFARRGLVREVIVDPSRIFYDSNVARHHHFFNLSTGELTDIAHEQLAIRDLPDLPAGTVLEGVDVIVRLREGDRGG